MAAPKWTPVRVALGALKPWADNPRYSTKAQAERLLKSWSKLGQFATVAIGPAGEVYDGHQRLSALLTVHGPEYEIDARQSDRALTDDERHSLTIAANVAVGAWDWDRLSGWDAGALKADGLDVEMLKDWKRDVTALTEMLKADEDDAGAEPQVDRAEELREKWQTERGQLWRIGEHRLLCGDCTVRDDVERVMGGDKAELVWTDPPYGVGIGDKNKYLNAIAPSNRVEKNLDNDTLDECGLVAMLEGAFDNAISVCTAGAAWYVAAPAAALHVLFGQALKERGIWRQTIQWVKNNATYSPMGVDYHWRAEPIFYGWLPNAGHRYYGGRKQDTVWNIDKPTKSPEHPTMKPVELVQRAVYNSSLQGDVVIDIFAGSGTPLVACQNLGRKCRAIEIIPAYCAVILERMATAFPGIEIALESLP